MVDTLKLKAAIVASGKKTKDVADMLGISTKSWHDRINKRKFDSDEMYKIVKYLNIQNPVEIFFADDVTQ